MEITTNMYFVFSFAPVVKEEIHNNVFMTFEKWKKYLDIDID